MDSPWLWSWARKRPGEAETRTVQLGDGDSDRVSFLDKQSGRATGPWARDRRGFIENSLSPMVGVMVRLGRADSSSSRFFAACHRCSGSGHVRMLAIGADARRLGQIQGAFLACHCHGGALVSCRLPFWRCGSDDVLVGVLTCSACGRLGAACSWLGSTDDQWGGAEGGVRPAVAMQRLIQESSVLRWPPIRSNDPIVSGKAQCNARERLPTGIGALSRSGREKPVPHSEWCEHAP